MRLALDTNRYQDLCRGDADVVSAVELAAEVYLPFVVLAELRAGFAVGRRGRDNERVLESFLKKPGVRRLFADDGTTRHYAGVYKQLRHQGTPIPSNDIWIAALVIQHDLLLDTRDRHFDNLPQLRLR